MAEELVIPGDQIELLRLGPNYGIKLTDEQQALVNSTPVSPVSEYLKYLKKVHPKRLEEMCIKNKFTPVTNYRKSYNTSMLLIKAYSNGLLSNIDSPEVRNFSSAYWRYKLACGVRLYGGIAALAAFNVSTGIPGFTSTRSFVAKNVLMIAAWWLTFTPVVESTWNNALPIMDLAARQNSAYLYKLHSENKILYRYPHTHESFPPNRLDIQYWHFLEGKIWYDEAHKNDFNGINRKNSGLTVYNVHKNYLPPE